MHASTLFSLWSWACKLRLSASHNRHHASVDNLSTASRLCRGLISKRLREHWRTWRCLRLGAELGAPFQSSLVKPSHLPFCLRCGSTFQRPVFIEADCGASTRGSFPFFINIQAYKRARHCEYLLVFFLPRIVISSALYFGQCS
ncbi:hypothetical protein B0H11DRAFT_2189170 [Mycena galericulata]|nr:hypothetical protein B0H11DRAFT_2189170 [Mycena galericulata]